jgi:hypothetical protein
MPFSITVVTRWPHRWKTSEEFHVAFENERTTRRAPQTLLVKQGGDVLASEQRDADRPAEVRDAESPPAAPSKARSPARAKRTRMDARPALVRPLVRREAAGRRHPGLRPLQPVRTHAEIRVTIWVPSRHRPGRPPPDGKNARRGALRGARGRGLRLGVAAAGVRSAAGRGRQRRAGAAAVSDRQPGQSGGGDDLRATLYNYWQRARPC